MGERRRLCIQIFQTNCMVADLYESFALWMFSFVITDVIKVQMYLVMMPVCEDSRSRRSVATLMRSMRKLTTDGVKLFYIACIFNAAYLLMVSFLTWVQYFDSIWLRNKLDNEELHMKADMLFLGLGFSASFAAIGNLMKVEDNFVLELKDFHPRSKFWVTKVLVTLAFLQECLLYFPPLNQLSNTRRDTIYSSASASSVWLSVFYMRKRGLLTTFGTMRLRTASMWRGSWLYGGLKHNGKSTKLLPR